MLCLWDARGGIICLRPHMPGPKEDRNGEGLAADSIGAVSGLAKVTRKATLTERVSSGQQVPSGPCPRVGLEAIP
jgi:hypothetical protein